MTSSKTKPTPPTQDERAAQIIGFEQGEYPYAHNISRKDYEAQKAALQCGFKGSPQHFNLFGKMEC